MNILVTGATGFVGKNLLPKLREEHNVFVLVRPQTKLDAVEKCGIFVFDDNISQLADYMVLNQIDGVVHLASLYISQHKSEEVKDMILSNVYLGTALLEACKMSKVKWFLNTGTIWQNYNAPDRSDLYNPVNLYAATKQAFVDLAKYYTETSDLRFCTLKLCDTYGPNDTRKKFISLFDQIAKSGEILDMSLGEQLVDLLHIDDVVSGFCLLVSMLGDDGKELRSEYVLTSGRHISLRDLAAQYEVEHNVKLNINWGGRAYREREVMKPYIGNILPGWERRV